MPDRTIASTADTWADLRATASRMEELDAAFQAAAKKRRRKRALKEFVWFVIMFTSVVALVFGFVTGLVIGCFQGAAGHDARAFGLIGLTVVLTGAVGFVVLRGLDRLSAWSLR